MTQSELQNWADGDDQELRRRIERLWDVGFVADISLKDGTVVSAVLIATSTETLTLIGGMAPRGRRPEIPLRWNWRS